MRISWHSDRWKLSPPKVPFPQEVAVKLFMGSTVGGVEEILSSTDPFHQVTWFRFPSTPAPFLPHVPVPNNNNHTNTTSTSLSTMRNSRRPKFTMMSGGLVVVEVRVLFMGQYIHHTQYRHSNTFWSLGCNFI